MAELTFVTGNYDKFVTGMHAAATYGITLVQASPDIDEVQSEDPEYIARQKAEAAYALVGAPVVVSDDSWAIPGLNGFPGSYMKSMNHWLTAEDFLRLASPLADRSCVLNQILVYQDATTQMVFTDTVAGTILNEPRGTGNIAWARLAALQGDNGKTIAEVANSQTDRSQRTAAGVWHKLLTWHKEYTG